MKNRPNSPTQIIALPRWGGALHRIWEKLAPDLHTRTGKLVVQINIPLDRIGYQSQLNLVYSTGNGLCGLGWSLSIPGTNREVLQQALGAKPFTGGANKRLDLIGFSLKG